MKKLIILEDTSKPKVGDIVQNSKKELGIIYKDAPYSIIYRNKEFDMNSFAAFDDDWHKVQFHIVDHKAENKLHKSIMYNKEVYFVEQLMDTEPKLAIGSGFINSTDGEVIIATSDPSLNLPKLSKSAIDYIIKNNGELIEFDLDTVENGDEEWGCDPAYYGEDSHNINIIPKDSTIEEAAEEYANKRNKVAVDGLHENVLRMLKEAFMAGANSNPVKELHTKGMYSKEDVAILCFKAFNGGEARGYEASPIEPDVYENKDYSEWCEHNGVLECFEMDDDDFRFIYK